MIVVFINGQQTEINNSEIVSDTINYLQMQFIFMTADWKEMRIWAHFIQGGKEYYNVELNENNVTPYLHLPYGEWEVYLHGEKYNNGELATRITSDKAKFNITESGMSDSKPFPDPTPSELERIHASMGDLTNLTTVDKSSLVNAINEVNKKGGSGEGGNSLTEEQAADLAANTKARHTHDNKSTLDKFSTDTSKIRPSFGTYPLALAGDVPSSVDTTHVDSLMLGMTADDILNFNSKGYLSGKGLDVMIRRLEALYAKKADLPKSDYINVKNYGAVGDGVTDDTAAIKTAVAEVPENGTLYFPIGTYRVDNIMLKSNMIVKGDGKGSIIKLNDNAPLTNIEERDDYWNNCFTIYQISNVKIENIALDGNKENNAATGAATDYRLNGIIIQESTDVIIDRIYAYNNGYHGCIMSDSVERVEISNSEFAGNGFRPFHGHGTIIDCKFINNRCINNGLGVNGDTTTGFDGIFFFDNCQRLLIDGNYVETNTNAGIDLGGSVLGDGSDASTYKSSSNIIVSNNIIKKSDTTNKTPAGIQLIPALLDKVTIEGNTIMDCRFGIRGQESSYSPLGSYINICNNIFRTTYGIYCPVVLKYANISNNQFVTCPEGGIVLAGATDTQITGNMFETIGAWTSATDKDGIVMTNCKRTVIANNRFYNKSTGHWSQYGVKEKGATDATLITGNTFQDMAVAAYTFVGSNSKAVNNIVNGAFEAEQTA